MTNHLPNIAPPEFKDIARLACLEVWGGQACKSPRRTSRLSWMVHSDPVETENRGGDVHYISVCSKGIISRFAIADVSGHGR